MDIIQRKECVITGKKDLEHLYTFKNFPVHMGVTDKCIEEDLKFDMTFMISKGSGMIQLKELIPLDVLYVEEHYNSIGDMWQKHHREFAMFIKKFNPRSVFEIGGARGILEKVYNEEMQDPISWTILEPVPNPIDGCKASFIRNFFDENYDLKKEEFDVLVHSHLLEHIYEPDKFIAHISDSVEDGKIMCFSLPNLKVMLKKSYTNVLNFEHTYFLTEEYIEYLLSKYKFELLECSYFEEDHSIFFAFKKNSTIEIKNIKNDLYEENKNLYVNYINEHKALVNKYNKSICGINRPVYLFGAHVFTQYLINFGLNIESVVCVLDNDKLKQGKRLSGTSFIVNSPNILKKEKNKPIIILRAGVHSREIKKDILENINPNVEFLE